MQKRNKKFLGILACAGMLATSAITTVKMIGNHAAIQEVKAARKSVKSRSYGVDVATYQSASLKNHARAGAKYAIVKVSEGTGYRNPKAAAQIRSAKAHKMMPMAYHFALFGANSGAAVREANYAISSSRAFGLPKGSYIACDWETGDGNNVNGGRTASANAIIAFMKRVKAKGYKPLLYSGASLLNHNINTSKVTKKFPNSLWVASYATMGRIDNPDFGYFPSIKGVAIWQFTDNWRGLNVDGNISLLPLKFGKKKVKSVKHKKHKHVKRVKKNSKIYNKKGKRIKGKKIKAGKKITVYGSKKKIKGKSYYRIKKGHYIRAVNVK